MIVTNSQLALRGRLGDDEVLGVPDARAGSDAGENASEVELGPNTCAATRDTID